MNGERPFNFNPGPAVLPLPVLERARDALLDYRGTGMGVLEMSHRSPEFDEILDGLERDVRALAGVGDDFAVLLTTGGATQQFSMVPMNLLTPDAVCDYVVTGTWSEKAAAEARKFAKVSVTAPDEGADPLSVPRHVEASPDSRYLYYASNETISGVQFPRPPGDGSVPLVCDASSDLFGRVYDVAGHGVIFAGAQKNLGAAGVTLVLIRKELVGRGPSDLPVLMNYATYAGSRSLYNTLPVFPVYVMAEVLSWTVSEGGIPEMDRRNRLKASLIYDVIDGSSLYLGVVAPEVRSIMNVTFRLSDPESESAFLAGAAARGLVALRGHKAFGGIRASMYNAMPVAGAEALADYMKEFEAGR